jgi:hypothetical protein
LVYFPARPEPAGGRTNSVKKRITLGAVTGALPLPSSVPRAALFCII